MNKVLLITASLLPASLALSSPGIAGDKAEAKTEEWQTFGPIRFDWPGWNRMEGSYVARGINSKEKCILSSYKLAISFDQHETPNSPLRSTPHQHSCLCCTNKAFMF